MEKNQTDAAGGKSGGKSSGRAGGRIDWNRQKDEILSRLDIRAECERMGIQFSGSPNSNGWIPCLNPYRPEKHPSCGVQVGNAGTRGFLVAFNGISQGNSRQAANFWTLCRDFHPEYLGMDYKSIIFGLAKKTGVSLGREVRPPTRDSVKFFRDQITREVREYLHNHRGLNDASITTFEIGWSDKRERLTFPVYDEDGHLVNIRFHAWKKDQKPKTQNWTGYGNRRLWGIDRLVKAAPGETVCITEGEWDSMLLTQETGLLSVSPTNGCEAFDKDWVAPFYGKHVALVWDCDEAGRQAVFKRVLPALRDAVRRGDILSVKAVWLFEDAKDKNHKDFTDFIVKAGGTGQALKDMIDAAEPEEFPLPKMDMPDAVALASFKSIDDHRYVGQRVSFPLYVYGENTEAYHAPTKVSVRECPGKKKFGCSGRADWGWSCDEPIPIRTGDRIQLSCVASSDLQMKSNLRDYVCDRAMKPALDLDAGDRQTIREVYAHQVLHPGDKSENELVEKPIYTIGSKIWPIGQYQATGWIWSHPRNQKPTMMVDTMVPMEEDWQAFDLDRSRPLLNELAQLDIDQAELVEDLMFNHTKIYQRYDLHWGVLLTLCSPRWIDLPGEGIIRGWVSSIIIGDTGTGKSMAVEQICKLAGVGYQVSGMTSSRTGITYACEYDERRGWRIKAGALLKMSGQALIVDEAQDLAEEDLKTMAEALDRGRLKIDRIQNREYAAETRCLFLCNPVNPRRHSDQKTMASFQYGCTAVQAIFPKMMLRRLDLALFAASFDFKDKTAVFNTQPPKCLKTVVTTDNLRALIHYAWNLKPEQIIISKPVADHIRYQAGQLSSVFGGCDDIPLVYAEDFRKTLCRLSVALAVIDLSSTDNFETITVKIKHVDYISDLIAMHYSATNCQLDVYAATYRKENTLAEGEEHLYQYLQEHMKDADRHIRVKTVMKELFAVSPDDYRQKLPQSYLKDLLDCDRTTVFRDLQPFVSTRLVKSTRGYLPTPKLFQFKHWLKNRDPYFLEDPEDDNLCAT